MARKKGSRRYTVEQKQEILRRVQAGESQTAIAQETGIPLVTIGYWVRKAKRGAAPAARRRGRPRKAQGGRQITAALEGDVLVIRIPLRSFARQLAQRALERI